ncbi:MAG: S41 family peptidase [Acidobacteria bacterium]|nr:MAG: S41 family peptidase [Acidobacteriota bacterium]
MRNRLAFFVTVVIITAALLGGWFGDRVSAGPPLEKDTQVLLKTFTEALAVIQANYIRPVTSETLIEASVRGMLRTLDPHSSFFATSDYSRLQEEQQGKYYGLGITIRAESPGSGRVVVVEPPAPGTPAYKVGMKAGDIISKIEGQSIEDWDVNEDVIPNLKGPKGTKVNITVERPGEPQPVEMVVERDEIPLFTIKYAFPLESGIGYIRLDKFSETSSHELDEALKRLEEASLKGLILDLRDNPGGSLSQAIEVADRFLAKDQLIVSTKGRQGREPHEYRAPRGRRYMYPMIVLINQNSASASEIVAGALQDHDRALIVGETSFGKALVQTIYPLDGRRGLALTTGRYYTPADRLIQRDYSQGFYDYFYTRAKVESKDRQQKQTDGGRTVYGGGGITPDYEVTLKADKLGRLIDRRNLFYDFATKLTTGEVKSDVKYDYSGKKLSAEEKARVKDELDVTDQTLSMFKQYLQEKKVAFSEQSFEESKDLIRNRLKQELFLLVFESDREGYRVALEVDQQVQKAIELLPQAQVLAQNSVARQR